MYKHTLFLALFLMVSGMSAEQPVVNHYISCGDNWFMSQSAAVDSPASINDCFEMFKQVYNTKRIYWRGLQSAITVDYGVVRKENFLYTGLTNYWNYLINKQNIEKTAADIAHRKGFEFWAVTQLNDWGVSSDTILVAQEFPGAFESKLRLEHPEWVPVDKYGYRKQGGQLELAYPEARKAVIDLLVKYVKEIGYDGIAFMTYSENFSMRFQDEFGYSEPIVKEYERRYGINIRTQNFTKFASRQDWYRLRGEYVTLFLKELKDALVPYRTKLSIFLNPLNPRKPMPWVCINQEFYTLGNINMDVDSWVQDGLVDELAVYGASSAQNQDKTIKEMMFLCRNTNTAVSFVSSTPLTPRWKKFYNQGVAGISGLGQDVDYLIYSTIPTQPPSALRQGNIYEKMRFLAQVVKQLSTCSAADVLPLLQHDNVMMRRLAVLALGKLKDVQSIPAIEQCLNDPEMGVRGAAIFALSDCQRAESLDAIFSCLKKESAECIHPLLEASREAIRHFQPFPYDGLVKALDSTSPIIRRAAIYSLQYRPREQDIILLEKMLSDSDRYTAYLAAKGLGNVAQYPKTRLILEQQLSHPDVAVADRIALSIGKNNVLFTGQERKTVLNELKKLFLQMGTNCQRDDRDWGYRAAGNALLAFGNEGEAILQEIQDTSPDRRLSELAWRVLIYREQVNDLEHNIISEKENDAMFKRRPAFLKTQLVDYIRQSFDNSDVFPSNLPATVGDYNKTIGRWSGFGFNGAAIDNSKAFSGKQSLQLRSNTSGVNVAVKQGPAPGYDFNITVWIYRSRFGGFTFLVRDRVNRDFIGLTIDPNGWLSLRNFKNIGPAWQKTQLQIPSDIWLQLTINTNFAEEKSELTVRDCSGQLLGRVDGQLHVSALSAERLCFIPNGKSDGTVNIDDVALFEIR